MMLQVERTLINKICEGGPGSRGVEQGSRGVEQGSRGVKRSSILYV